MQMSQPASSHSLRGMKPVAELAARREHGDRLRYLGGCRCDLCRRANSAYEAARKVARAAGLGNGIVPAAKARAHLKALSACGVGRRAVKDACDVGETVLQDIAAGRKLNIRAGTERAILAVTEDAAGDGALVSAKHTWKLLNELIADGFKKYQLAILLGTKAKNPSLQLRRDFITVRSAYLVERLFNRIRFTNARETIKLLAALREEGYTQHQIDKRLASMAHELGQETPHLIPNKKGRISASAADLVNRLYRELTR